MKNPTLIAVVAGALAGFGGAALSTTLFAPPTNEAAPVAVTPGKNKVDVVALVDEIKGQNADILARLESLERAPSMMGAPREAVPVAGEVQTLALDESLQQLATALGNPNSTPPPNFTASVASALDLIREQEEAERDLEREQRRLERNEERIQEMVTKLSLDAYQTDEMRNILAAQDARFEEIREASRDMGDFWSSADQFRETRDEYNAKVQSVLSPTQFEQYEESRGFGLGGFGGRGNDRGGFGGGGRGGRD